MYSNPAYDPNDFVGVPFEEAQDAITELQNADGNPLLANAYQERYMPGSTFKVITTGIGLEAGVLTRETEFPREQQYVPPQTNDPINNYNGSQWAAIWPKSSVGAATSRSPKTAIELGVDRFIGGTNDWGIDEQLPFDLPRAATSTIGNVENLGQTLPLLAIRGFGRAKSRWCRCTWQWCGCGRKRGPDDEPVRRRCDVRPCGPRAHPHLAKRVEDPDLTRDCGPRNRVHDRRKSSQARPAAA